MNEKVNAMGTHAAVFRDSNSILPIAMGSNSDAIASGGMSLHEQSDRRMLTADLVARKI